MTAAIVSSCPALDQLATHIPCHRKIVKIRFTSSVCHFRCKASFNFSRWCSAFATTTIINFHSVHTTETERKQKKNIRAKKKTKNRYIHRHLVRRGTQNFGLIHRSQPMVFHPISSSFISVVRPSASRNWLLSKIQTTTISRTEVGLSHFNVRGFSYLLELLTVVSSEMTMHWLFLLLFRQDVSDS